MPFFDAFQTRMAALDAESDAAWDAECEAEYQRVLAAVRNYQPRPFDVEDHPDDRIGSRLFTSVQHFDAYHDVRVDGGEAE